MNRSRLIKITDVHIRAEHVVPVEARKLMKRFVHGVWKITYQQRRRHDRRMNDKYLMNIEFGNMDGVYVKYMGDGYKKFEVSHVDNQYNKKAMEYVSDLMREIFGHIFECIKPENLEISWTRDLSEWTLTAWIIKPLPVGTNKFEEDIESLYDLCSISMILETEHEENREYYAETYKEK